MKTSAREYFDCCWPHDARIKAVEVSERQLRITFDRFMMTPGDPWNQSDGDLTIGECQCCFEVSRGIELRLWPDGQSYRIDEDITKLVGCSLENSEDKPSEHGHYFELSGFCDGEWFELRIYSDRYDLVINEPHRHRTKFQAEQASDGDA